MININDFRNFILYAANKSGKGALPTPSQFNSFCERALMEWTMKRYGNRAEYQPGRPIPRISYDKTQAVMDDLRHLKYEADMLVNNGRFGIPDGTTVTDRNSQVLPEYLHLSTIRGCYYYTGTNGIEEKEIPVPVVSDKELSYLLDSSICQPTFAYPAANIQSTYVLVYPKTFQYVHIVYLRQPYTPVWAYTTVNGRPVYDPANSTDLDAPKEAFNEIAMGVLSFMGINMREGELLQYAEMNKQQGI